MGLMRPLPVAPDAAARARALEAGASFLVDAPAGSGKTELLIQRYLRLLALVEAPEAVVALTFTVKAAAEMRTRVLDALERAAGSPRPGAPHAALTWDLAAAVLERDREHAWNLRTHPARMRIQTIDALCAAVTRRMPWLSRFGAQPEVTEHAEDLYREAARRLVARLPEPVAVLLERLDNDAAGLTKLVAEMLARRDQWLRHIVERAPRAELEQGLRTVIQDELARLRERVPPACAGEIAALARVAAGNLRASGRESEITACEGLTALPGTEPGEAPQWLGIAGLLLTDKGEWRRQVNVSTGFPADQKEVKRRCEQLLRALEREEEFREALKGVKKLPPPAYDEDAWQALEALSRVLLDAAAELQMVFGERGLVDFAEVAQRASVALGSEDHPTDLALALDYRIQHVLVDEFQDTSLSQYRLLRQLTAGWERGDGRTLFLVGDPMQSIYRFREAEVGLFLRARQEGIGTVAVEPLRLEMNFRSQAGIVEWVNRVFREVFPRREDIPMGAVTYQPSVAREADEEQTVRVHPFFGEQPRAEAERTVELIREARTAQPAGTIAILARARTHLPHILRALAAAGLRYRAIEIDELGTRPVIQDLLALVRALEDASDRTAWLAVLRGPWCGLTLADLHTLAADEAPRAIWDVVREEGWLERLGPDGRARLTRVREVLGAAFGHRRREPLRGWVERTWVALGGPACLRTETDAEDAEAFFQLLETLEEGGEAPDGRTLAEKAAGLFAAPDLEADESLHVLTIHKAKGLEFDTVILPGLGSRPRVDEGRLLAWLETTGSHGESLLLLAPVKPSGGATDPIVDYVRGIERKKEEHEAARLLYVAATRARRRLHLLGHVPVREQDGKAVPGDPESGSLLARLWPVVAPEFAARWTEGSGPVVAEEAQARGETRLRRLRSGWMPPPAPAAVAWQPELPEEAEAGAAPVSFDWAGETRRHVGTVVHRLLRRIAEEGVDRWDGAAVAQARPVTQAALGSLGVPPAEIAGAAAEVERALAASLADPRGRWILERSHAGARCEYALAGLVRGRLLEGVLDRTFVDAEGTRWIIDYKTGAHEGAGAEAFLDAEQERYRAQLEGYAALFAGLEQRPIRLGLYFPLMGAWREWGYGES